MADYGHDPTARSSNSSPPSRPVIALDPVMHHPHPHPLSNSPPIIPSLHKQAPPVSAGPEAASL
ncbi:hypothetical protein ColTof4_14135 [Colletotrichum tofieldiae]|nr:hypothetical protein ColTof3_02946 [Colletotrichum tofieldiae]GKT81712.1 hypothetical protein ColTof4_14135 [Colletotrichum tofieldiae]